MINASAEAAMEWTCQHQGLLTSTTLCLTLVEVTQTPVLPGGPSQDARRPRAVIAHGEGTTARGLRRPEADRVASRGSPLRQRQL